MPRLFFHLVNEQESILDHEGVEVAPSEVDQINRIVDEIRSENPELFDADGDWSIEVTDEQGRKLGGFPIRP